ncbi:hypothetical protein NQ315_000839 [Exocentrus adspersus]|uniref:PIN domain-containing protein n=1 Tax=Exocentrus adspersus TaxID=1586481 RepID=A0AAV8WDV7_9CUCU|nr:hypothetical protein NQ315_000839 [Exocentrus adspersus]
MSLPKEERPKLKAKSFNRFETASAAKIAQEDADVTKRGFKRTRLDDDGSFSSKPKRMCTRFSDPPTATKNLANNRLLRLKEQLRLDLSSTNTVPRKASTPEDSIRNTCTNANISTSPFHPPNEKTSRTSGKSFAANTSTDGKHKTSPYKNYKSTPVSSTSKRNLAQERLRNIKSSLSTNDCSNQTSSNLDEDVHTKPAPKRDLSAFKGIESPPKSVQSRLTLKQSTIKNVVSVSDFHKDSPYAATENLKPTGQSISSSSENMCGSQAANIFGSNSTSTIQRLSDVEHEHSLKYQKCDNFMSFGQSPLKMSEKGVEGVGLNPSSGSSNFLGKQDLAASWIRNCQSEPDNDGGGSAEISTIVEAKPECSRHVKTDEEMEWTNAWPSTEVDLNKNVDESKSSEDETVTKVSEKCKSVCIVVDTNVFISALSKLQDILNLKTAGPVKPIIFIPWMVITELDYMKDSSSNNKLSRNINSAIKFINAALNDKHPQVIGQTVFDVQNQKYIGSSPDDKIISCCIQAAEKYENVILLSNDMNLKNKAMINDITACSSNEIMMRVMSKLAKNTKVQKIMNRMGIMCSSVICDCMKTAYGGVWLKMDMMNHPPWSLVECLKRFRKYWTAVFSEKLLKQFTKTVQDLQDLLETNTCISDDSDEFVEFMKLCVSLCIFLKDIEECRGFIENTLTHITKTA